MNTDQMMEKYRNTEREKVRAQEQQKHLESLKDGISKNMAKLNVTPDTLPIEIKSLSSHIESVFASLDTPAKPKVLAAVTKVIKSIDESIMSDLV